MQDEKEKKLPVLQTYKNDIAETIEKNNLTIENVALNEVNNQIVEKNKEKKHINIFAILGIIVILLSISFYFIYQKIKPAPIIIKEVLVSPSNFIYSEPIALVLTSRENISKTIKEKIDSIKEASSITTLSITKKYSENDIEEKFTAQDFVKSIFENDEKLDSLSASLANSLYDEFAIGKYKSNDEMVDFLLFKVKNKNFAIGQILSLENNLLQNISKVLPIKTTSPATNFTDKTFYNTNTRTIIDSDKNIILFYSFISQDYLLISTNPNAINKITSQLK